jgi:hypothetical protein
MTMPRNRGPRESVIESYLKKRIDETPFARIIKLQKVRGWMDRLVLVKGQVWFVECKRPRGGRFEPLQQRYAQWLVHQGYNYVLLNTKEGVDAWLSGL